MVNAMQPVTSSSVTGLTAGQWWSGEAYPWRVAQTTVSGTQTVKILWVIVRPYAGAVHPGFLLVQDDARPHVAKIV